MEDKQLQEVGKPISSPQKGCLRNAGRRACVCCPEYRPPTLHPTPRGQESRISLGTRVFKIVKGMLENTDLHQS